jgi:alkylhydroperoxidase family enzyme
MVAPQQELGKVAVVDCRTGQTAYRDMTAGEAAEATTRRVAAEADAAAREAEMLAFEDTLDRLQAWPAGEDPVDREVVEDIITILLRLLGREGGK